MKKLLTLFVVVCMLLSAIHLVAFADNNVAKPESGSIPEAPTAVEDKNTVYISLSKGDDSATGTESAPRLTLGKALAKAVDNANKAKVKVATICVLDDGILTTDTAGGICKDASDSIAKTFAQSGGTVYIFGRYNEETKSYPRLLGTAAQGTKAAANHIILENDTVFYNINIDNGDSNFTINAAFHNLTIGENFSGKSATGKGGCLILGAGFTDSTPYSTYYASVDKRAEGVSINIYSGTFNAVHATYRDTIVATTEITHPTTVNIYGEDVSIALLQDVTNGADTNANTIAAKETKKLIKNSVTFNVYGGTIDTFRANAVSDSTQRTYLNDSIQAHIELNGALAGLKERNIMNAKYCGVQDGVVNGKGAVRFVGIVDSLEYEAVGFEITAVEQNFDFTTSCRYVYSSLLGTIDGEPKTYTAAELGGNYIYAVAIQNIPLTGTVTFKVRSFVKQNGTTYYGKEYTETYTNGKYVEEAKTFRVASLNLRNHNDNTTEENAFDARMPRIIHFINTEKPDSIGVQECDLKPDTGNMRAALDSGITGSGYVCAQEEQRVGLLGKDFAFKNFIWYNSNTTECTDSGQYWLSETPDQASTSFGTEFYISMGWAKLRNKATGYVYVHVNTHLVVGNPAIRLQEIEVLLNKVNELTDNGNLPVFLTGDMNSQPGSAEYNRLTETFQDTRYMTTNTTGSNTFAAFGTEKNPRIIDFCLCSADENAVGINRFQVVDQYDGGWLSDHNALLVDVRVTASAQQK